MAKRRAEVQATERAVYRVTPGEKAALQELARRHGEELRKMGVTVGSENAWFRALLLREAEAVGVKIVEPIERATTAVAAGSPRRPQKPAGERGR